MLIDKLMDRTIPALSKALDLTWKRNEALSSNIANAETPGYRAVDINFAGELERAFDAEPSSLSKTDPKHMDTGILGGEAHTSPDMSGATKPDGNNVDIDLQMGRLAFNSGKYTMATSMLKAKISMFKNMIREGGR